MKGWIWLRGLAAVLALFALGHTLGTVAPHVTRGPQQAAVVEAMQTFRFPIMGFSRTYWDFYRGFAFVISVQLVVMTIVAWQLSVLGKSNPRAALPMAVTLQIGCVGLAILSWMFFFGGPIVTSVAAVICSTGAVARLSSDIRGRETQPARGFNGLAAPSR
jgi:hypothetical protein